MPTRVPHVFHFIFGLQPPTAPFSLMHSLCLESCRQVNQPERIVFHYEHEPWGPNWERVKPYLDLRRIKFHPFVQSFNYSDPVVARFRYAHAADFTRVEILQREGGVYADMDTLFVQPIPERLYDQEFVMGREQLDSSEPDTMSSHSLCNALMMSAPGSKFAGAWLERMQSEFDGSWSRHSCSLPYELGQEMPDAIRIEPKESFFKCDPTREGIADLFTRSQTDLRGVYSVHLWAHLWWDRKRRDFSLFYGDRITPAYVRCAESTYARIARRYLPKEMSGGVGAFLAQRMVSSTVLTVDDLAARVGRTVRRVTGRGSKEV